MERPCDCLQQSGYHVFRFCTFPNKLDLVLSTGVQSASTYAIPPFLCHNQQSGPKKRSWALVFREHLVGGLESPQFLFFKSQTHERYRASHFCREVLMEKWPKKLQYSKSGKRLKPKTIPSFLGDFIKGLRIFVRAPEVPFFCTHFCQK